MNQITKKSAWNKPLNVDDTAFIDSAASLTLLHNRAPADDAPKQQQKKTVTIPNGAQMHTTKTIKLRLDLPEKAKIGHRMPKIINNLVSAPALCDAGCEVKFTKKEVVVTHNDKVVLEGWRDPTNNLWRVPLIQEKVETANLTESKNYYDIFDDDDDESDTERANKTDEKIPEFCNFINSIYDCKNDEHLTKFYHATFGSPVKSTFLNAIRMGYLKGCPGLSSKSVENIYQCRTSDGKGSHGPKTPRTPIHQKSRRKR
jgi:hypothetical protein